MPSGWISVCHSDPSASCDAGLNIDSLAVGLNVDTALFTITVTSTQSLAEQMLSRVVALSKVALAVGKLYVRMHHLARRDG